MKRACVIGAGYAGLALAIRLQTTGITTVLIEGRDGPGGLSGPAGGKAAGFEMLPVIIDDADALDDLMPPARMPDQRPGNLLPMDPLWRTNWGDGTAFDMPADAALMRANVARLAPGDLAGYEDFAGFAETARAEGLLGFGQAPRPAAADMLRSLPDALRLKPWRTLHGLIASHIKSDHLREALSVNALAIGGNPMSVSAGAAWLHGQERRGGLWWPAGGPGALAAQLAAQFTQAGGELRLGDPASTIHTTGNRASEVETASGWRERFDAVASAADIMHSYRDLLGHTPRGRSMADSLARMRWSPSAFVLHLTLDGSFPAIPHLTVMLPARFGALFEDVFEHGVLSRDMAITLHHPAATNPAAEKRGSTRFTAVVPVPHLGKLPLDWASLGPLLAERALDEVALRLIPDVRDRLTAHAHATPPDFASALNLHLGSIHGLEPTRLQSLWLRGANRDAGIVNFYLAGASIHPGAGFAAEMVGAKLTAALMLEQLRG